MAITLSQIEKRLRDKNVDVLSSDIRRVMKIILSEISDALYRSQSVEIRGAFRVSTKMQKPYIGRNPKTGAKVNVPSKRVVKFKASSILIKKLNKNFTENEISANN